MAATKPAFTYEDLAHTPDDGKRDELHDGELVVSPAPTFEHQSVVTKLGVLLTRAEEAGYGRSVVAPVDVVFGPHKVAQPDLPIIRRDRLGITAGGKVHGVPDLVVEILSPGSRDSDFGRKMALYAREGVSHYWIVDPDARTVRPYTLRQEGYIAEPVLRAGDTLGCPPFPGITTDAGRLFV